MCYTTVLLVILMFNYAYCNQQNVLLKWVSAQNLPKSGDYLTMVKNLTKFQDPDLCAWYKGTDGRLLGKDDFQTSYVPGSSLDQCSLSLKSYNKETHQELDYYKPFLLDKSAIDSSMPQNLKQKSGFVDEPSDLVYALAYFDKSEFKLHENATDKPNERKFMCHTKLFVKAHELGQDFTDAITERLQNQVLFEMKETLRISKRKVIASQFSLNSSHNFFNWISKPRTTRETNMLIDYITGDYKTVYMSDIQVLVSLCCTLRILNDDNSIFFDETICAFGESLHKYNQILLFFTVTISILFTTANRRQF